MGYCARAVILRSVEFVYGFNVKIDSQTGCHYLRIITGV